MESRESRRPIYDRYDPGREVGRRHWSPASETYTSGDVLLQYLRAGWQLDSSVFVETVHYADSRQSKMFYFTLKQNSKSIKMPILATPTVFRIVNEHQLNVVPGEGNSYKTLERSPD